MSRRAYHARRAQRQRRPKHNDGAGLAMGECLVCERRLPLIVATGLCQMCTTHEEDAMPIARPS